ncbi:MAG: bifunctional riboflavin kinase/FAD synthetase [Bacteroidetes bacterium]|nr:bifunctional riboflavin kinase/FAD synthetase [Bacteroidota bacterium]
MSKVYFSLEDFPSLTNTIVTIGTFDGVHVGHKKIFDQLNELKKQTGYQTVVFTFDPHPRKILFPEQKDLKLITSTHEKIKLISENEIDYVLVYPFSKKFSEISSDFYIENILVKKLGAKVIIIGYDHKFGKNREGNIEVLKNNAAKYGFEVIEISAKDIDSINVSSSQIRKAIDAGDIDLANKFLGHSYFLTGMVTEGKKLGRTIGYPTANVKIADVDKLLPKIGVYAVKVKVLGNEYGGMLNIGVNPTTDTDNKIKIEVNIFDFNQDIYGETISIKFVKRLRDEVKFANLEELKIQLLDDRNKSLDILK